MIERLYFIWYIGLITSAICFGIIILEQNDKLISQLKEMNSLQVSEVEVLYFHKRFVP